MRTPPASVIVLSYNTRDLTLQCLSALCPAVLNWGWQVIVVDNASTDGTAQTAAELSPEIEVIRNEKNLGYAAGNNLGLRQAEGQAIILLNSDVVATPEDLRTLVQFLHQNPEVGAVSAGLLTSEAHPQAFAFGNDPRPGYLIRRGIRHLLGRGPLHDWNVDQPLEVDWVSGACLCVRREVIEQIGLLDECFFLYFEDNDWCLRMRKAGWRVVYNPQVTVTHLGGASQRRRAAANRHYQQSLVTFYAKHYGLYWALCIHLMLTLYTQLQGLSSKLPRVE
jgi:hypothetical protein